MKKILILETGKVINNMISPLFMNEDYKILKSKNESGKYLIAPDRIPDLVIADLTSIKNEKVELLMQLKNNPVISFVPFLLITSPDGRHSHNNRGTEEWHSVLNYYLSKPFSKDELFIWVNKILTQNDNVSPW